MLMNRVYRLGVALIVSIRVIASAQAFAIYPIRVVSLEYPCLATKTDIRGIVQVQCSLDVKGRCLHPIVVSGPPLLAQAAEVNLKEWRFAFLSDSAQKRNVSVTYIFQLENGIAASKFLPTSRTIFNLPAQVKVVASRNPEKPCKAVPLE